MHILLTDILTCPHCGPAHGLILLADRIVERRVLEGRLGCPHCRRQYPIRGGFADLRQRVDDAGGEDGAAQPAESVRGGAGSGEAAFRVAALMGVTRGPGYVLLTGGGVDAAPAIAELIEGIEVIALGAGLEAWAESPGVSRMAVDAGLPFFDGRLRAVAFTAGASAGATPADAARVLAPGGRLVWEDAGEAAAEALEEAGLRLLARQGGTMVAALEK